MPPDATFRSARRLSRAAMLCLLLASAGCAATDDPAAEAPGPGPSALEHNDPGEQTNRAIFEFNEKIDHYALQPVAEAYVAVTPDPVRQGVSNLLDNLNSPAILMSDMLQGNMPCAGQTLARLGLNTTLGLGGLLDVGTDFGIPRHNADFGQTLGAWGFDTGPYIVVPFFGPYYLRDGVGYVVDKVADPYTDEFYLADMNTPGLVRFGVGVIDLRARNLQYIDDLRRNSVDFYAVVRSALEQRREAAVTAAQAPSTPGCSLGE